MTTRLGTKYQKYAPQPSLTMELSLEDLLRAINQNQTTINQMNEQFIQIKDQNQTTPNQLTDLIAQMTQTNN